ncbi:MAG: MFS transporter [Nocardioides sp.]|uniref:MFS transporter n=1 Tax=Nocardioides sp. TaxID=35761 RepID=UPI0039E56BDE
MSPPRQQIEQLHNIGRRRAWVIWVVAVSVYVLAVFHRSSLGVAGLLAADRFGISATELASFTVLQLLVYAGMQIPVGVMLDRFGSRVMLLAGLAAMTLAQLAFAFATTFSIAALARAVLGAGDAMIFGSVLRLVTAWFLVRQAPLVTQLTGQVGQLGAIAAAGPLAWALHALGWTRTFAVVSSIGVVLMVAVALLVKDSPYRVAAPVVVKMRVLARSLRSVWGNPGTRLGMWSHFTSPFSVTIFGMLWGYPFLVQGEGLSSREAGILLMVMTGWVMVAGPAMGLLVARFPYYRSPMVVGVVTMIAVVWTIVLAQSGPAPIWLLVVLVLAIATGGPASMVGFDLARTFMPQEASGRANGVVNIGGFLAALLTIALVGIVLDWRQPAGMAAYDLADFRIALSVQYPVWLLGVVQILRFRRKALAHLARVHPGSIEQLKRGEPFVHPGFSDREGV